MAIPDLTPPATFDGEPGWTRLERPPRFGVGRSFVSGEPDGDRLRVAYFRRGEDDAVVGRAWFGPGAEGPPHHAHGGSMAALLDDVMGAVAWVTGHPVLAARLDARFRKPLPLGQVITFEAWVADRSGRRLTTRARLVGPEGELYAEGEGLMIELPRERIMSMLSSG